MKKTGKSLVPHAKVWISSADREGTFGSGKCRLLETIEQEGSLSSAAKTLGISYRKAWGDLKKAEAGLGIMLIEKQRGGADGGTTRLTAEGKQLLKTYQAFCSDIDDAVQAVYQKHYPR